MSIVDDKKYGGGYLNNNKLKKVGVEISFSKEQAIEMAKCSADPVYFIKNYVKIVSLDHGVVPFELWPFQERMVETFHDNRFCICKMPRQVGKCFFINTPIRLRNKKTGEVINTTIGEFYEQQQLKQSKQQSSTGSSKV